MLRLELIEVTEVDVKYRYYPEDSKKYGIVIFRKTTRERDIEEKGVSVEGRNGPKKNDSVALLVNVNKQMLIILDKLGLNANTIKPEDGADV